MKKSNLFTNYSIALLLGVFLIISACQKKNNGGGEAIPTPQNLRFKTS